MEILSNHNKSRNLSERQRRLLRGLASGLSLTKSAEQENYSLQHASYLVGTPAAVEELRRLRSESEKILLEALPGLIEQSIEVLRCRMTSNITPHRMEAATFILKNLAAPMLRQAIKGNALDPESVMGVTIDQVTDHTNSSEGGAAVTHQT